MCVAALTLQGCGGGGGGSVSDAASTPPSQVAIKPSAIEHVATDFEPPGGVVIDDLLPRNEGDTLTYDVMNEQGQPTGVQEIETVKSRNGESLAVQSVHSDGSFDVTSNYRYNAQGISAHISFFEEFDAQITPRIDDIVIYPRALPPAGQVRSVIRQGDLGRDLDGDGTNDAYRFEFKQTLVGEELRSTALSRSLLTVYHLQTTVTHTLMFSNAQVMPFTRSVVSDDYLLPGVGIVSSKSDLRSSDPAESRQVAIELKRAQVGQRTFGPVTLNKQAIEVPVRVVKLVHAPTRQWFLGVVASTGSRHDNAIVAIEGATGKILGYSQKLPAQIRSVKAAATSDVVYVTQETGEIVKFSLVAQSSTPLVESARMQMPAPTGFSGLIYVPLDLAVSPTDPDVLAVAASRQGSFTSDVFLVRSMGVVDQVVNTASTNLGFSANGQRLLTVNTANSGDRSISLFNVTNDRLSEVTSIPHAFITSPINIDAFGNQFLINDETFSAIDLAMGPAFQDNCRVSSYQGRTARECELTLTEIDSKFDLASFSLTDSSAAFGSVLPGSGGTSARWTFNTNVVVLVDRP